MLAPAEGGRSGGCTNVRRPSGTIQECPVLNLTEQYKKKLLDALASLREPFVTKGRGWGEGQPWGGQSGFPVGRAMVFSSSKLLVLGS